MKVDVVLPEADMAQEFAEALEARDLPEKFFYWFPRSAQAWAALTNDDELYGGLRDTWEKIAAEGPVQEVLERFHWDAAPAVPAAARS